MIPYIVLAFAKMGSRSRHEVRLENGKYPTLSLFLLK